VAWVTTNAALAGNPPAASTNSDGIPIYIKDIHASSYLMTSELGPSQDLPGWTQIIQNGQADFAIAVVTTVGGSNGNYSGYQFDIHNSVSHFPKWVAGAWNYNTNGWLDVVKINHGNGNLNLGTTGSAVVVAGTSFATGTSQSVTLQPGAGMGIQISSAGIVNQDTGGNSTGTTRNARFVVNGPALDGYSTAASPGITAGLAGGGIGIYQDSGDAHFHFSAGGADAGYIAYNEHTNWYPKGGVFAHKFLATNTVTAAQFIGAQVVNASATGAITIDGAATTTYALTMSGAITCTVTNIPDTGNVVVDILGDASHAVSWVNVYWSGGTAPVQNLSKHDVYTFVRINGRINGYYAPDLR
jgi:hypothetical protein